MYERTDADWVTTLQNFVGYVDPAVDETKLPAGLDRLTILIALSHAAKWYRCYAGTKHFRDLLLEMEDC